MSQVELVFLHIPKTAGTSQHQSFNRHYGERTVFWIGEDCPPDIARFPGDAVAGHRIMGGHKPLAFYPADLDALYCAVLRDPVERAISLFCYYTRPDLGGSEGERLERENQLRRTLDLGIDPENMGRSIRENAWFRKDIANMQCRYLSRGRPTFAAVQASLARHDMLIGTLPSYGQFHQFLSGFCGWPDTATGWVNRSRADYMDEYLADRELVELIRELNREDARLIEHVNHEHGGMLVNIANSEARQARVRAIPPCPVEERKPADVRGQGLLPEGRDNALAWPARHLLALPEDKLLYAPIPGAANSLVVDLLATHMPIVNREQLPREGLMPWLSVFNLGAMLKDFPQEEAQALMADPGCRALTLIRDPVARLVEIYVDHIVRHPQRLRGQPLFIKSLAAVQKREQPDLERGMSFREFVDNICASTPGELGVARAPQVTYLQPLAVDYTLFREDQLPRLLEAAGVSASVRAPFADRIRDIESRAGDFTPRGELAEASPADLRALSAIEPASLVDAALAQRLRDYYREDYDMYRTVMERTAGEVTVAELDGQKRAFIHGN